MLGGGALTPCPKPQPRPKRKPRGLSRGKRLMASGFDVQVNKRLQRKKRMRKGPSRRTQRLTAEDKRHLAWKAARPCVWAGQHLCGPFSGGRPVIQVAHFRDMTGASRKEGARLTLPLCPDLHAAYDQAKGVFYGTTKATRKAWFMNWVNTLNLIYDQQRGAVDVEEMP